MSTALLLDDRKHQHEKADEYAPLLQSGRKIMVNWVAVSLKNDAPGVARFRKDGFECLESAKSKLEAEFGPAIGMRFNLGKPGDTPLGVSEPKEHEARVLELDQLIRERRDGRLHVGVRPRSRR